MKSPPRRLKFFLAVCLILSGISILVCLIATGSIESWIWPAVEYTSCVRANLKNTPVMSSAGMPSFIFYVRFTYSTRWAKEFKNVLVRSMKLFVPNNIAKLVVVLDAEDKTNEEFAEEIRTEWPYPDICYMTRGNPRVYYYWGKARMFWDMLHPDFCTNATYVGFVDTDTLFDTLVTPKLLFEDKKPVIVGKIGLPPYPCWVKSTEKFLMKKEVMNCMSTFPVTVKIQHIKEMRERLSTKFVKDFGRVFKESAFKKKSDCICQFSFICNYLWYYHRNEYSWHLQTVPNGDWNGVGWRDGQVDPKYYHTVVKPEMKIPIPRTSVHLRYTIIKGVKYDKEEPPREKINEIIKEGLCYSAGFQYCPGQCKKWDQSVVQYHLYSFESYQWFWDSRCKEEQDKHYKNVKRIVAYHVQNKLEIFGLKSIKDLCKTIADWTY